MKSPPFSPISSTPPDPLKRVRFGADPTFRDDRTGILLYRRRNYFGMLQRLLVIVDGAEAGSLSYGARVFIAMTPGTYSIQVAMDWCKSRPLNVDMVSGRTIRLECGTRLREVYSAASPFVALFLPHKLLVVRQLSGDRYPSDKWGMVVYFAISMGILILALILLLL